MPSLAKSKTARINGAKSRGPKTEAGKQASSQNALTHGFTARHTLILQCESPDDFQEMLAEHIAIYLPATAPEKELIDQMAAARWRIRRFVASETVLIDCEMVRNHAAVAKEFAPTDSGVHLALALRSLADESRSLALMSRYESRLQRIHDRAYTALRELQQARTAQSPQPTSPQPAQPHPDPTPAAEAGPPQPAATPSVENKKSQKEPTSPRRPSVSTVHPSAIHLCPPLPPAQIENSGNHEG